MAPSKESFRLSTQDASLLYGEAANAPLNMAMLALFRSRIDFKSLRAHMAERMHLLPRYRQRVVFAPLGLAHPSLQEDPDFDLANHLFCHADAARLDRGGGDEGGDAGLRAAPQPWQALVGDASVQRPGGWSQRGPCQGPSQPGGRDSQEWNCSP